jgi:hypothetical protein
MNRYFYRYCLAETVSNHRNLGLLGAINVSTERCDALSAVRRAMEGERIRTRGTSRSRTAGHRLGIAGIPARPLSPCEPVPNDCFRQGSSLPETSPPPSSSGLLQSATSPMTNGGNPGAGAVPVVTQQMLRRARELHTEAEEYERVRQAIRELLQAGAQVEPGELTATLRTTESHRICWPTLERLLGVERVAELRQQVEPSICRQLYISTFDDPQIRRDSWEGPKRW